MIILIIVILICEYDKSNCYIFLNMIIKNKDESVWGILYFNLMIFIDIDFFGSV